MRTAGKPTFASILDLEIRKIPHNYPQAKALVERGLALKLVPGLSPRDLAPPGPLARGWVLDTMLVMNRLQVHQNEIDQDAMDNA